MKPRVEVPVKVHDHHNWGELNMFGDTHHVCAERVELVDEKYSFAGGHRVRLYKLKKNVHWRIPDGVVFNIQQVQPAQAPRRRHDHRH
jgi:hypothetical protein